jgi:hypothetical protein
MEPAPRSLPVNELEQFADDLELSLKRQDALSSMELLLSMGIPVHDLDYAGAYMYSLKPKYSSDGDVRLKTLYDSLMNRIRTVELLDRHLGRHPEHLGDIHDLRWLAYRAGDAYEDTMMSFE